MSAYDPLKEVIEIREQLASDKRKLGFLWGSGTSMAVGLPGIFDLTNIVGGKLKSPYKQLFDSIRKELEDTANVEDILNRIRLYRELIGNSDTREGGGIKGKETGKALDIEICKTIADAVSATANIKPHEILSHWIRSLHANREYPVEIFTTNYDLLIEQALEHVQVPYFDGFIGSIAPFFIQESIETRLKKEEVINYYPPKSWTRIWKLHGSINWYFNDLTKLICRCTGKPKLDGQELMIFPSREKYVQSRKLPFIALQDRFRNFLANGEVLLIILGYRFSDEHLNDIIFQGIRSNPHLSVMAFMHNNLSPEFEEYGKNNRKLTFYAPDKICVGGITSEWKEPENKEGEGWHVWDYQEKRFLLGDFNEFASYIEAFIGFNISYNPSLNEKQTPEKISSSKT